MSKELNDAVAVSVMGWTLHSDHDGHAWYDGSNFISVDDWMPSEDILDAWKVIERMCGEGGPDYSQDFAAGLIEKLGLDYFDPYPHAVLAGVLSLLTPEVVCRAALGVMEVVHG